MLEMTALSRDKSKNRLASFTLVELLTVITIIVILAALTLAAASGIMTKAKRSRAAGEIQAISTALESYKADNGIYVPSDGTQLLTNNYSSYDGTSLNYQTNGQLLYQALSGQTNFTDAHVPGRKAYMSFKRNQVGDAAGGSYVQDPWGYSYGYSTGTTNNAPTPQYPYSGSGFFDLWSTGGLLKAQVNTNTWISNWR